MFVNIAFAQDKNNGMQQVTLLLLEKQARTPSERKIDSRLLQAVREKRGQKMAIGVDLEPVNVNADEDGYLKVDIDGTINNELIRKIESVGGSIIYPSPQYHTARVLINLSMVETMAAFTEVSFIKPAAIAATVGSGSNTSNSSSMKGNSMAGINICTPSFFNLPIYKPAFELRAEKLSRQLTNYLHKNFPFSGSVNSEGDRTHRADDARTTYGYAGQGIRIGIMSDSYNALNAVPADISSGNLPGASNPNNNLLPVTVLQDYVSGSDEGRAMLQIVHDIAPKAQLFYATAFISEAGFATNIQALRNPPYNCDIIIDDIYYYDEPVFQDGIVAQAVNTVTASGALYFSSAGNEGSISKNTSGYYESDFNDAGSPVFSFPGGTKAGTIHNFGTLATPVNGDIITAVGNTYNLNWADPMGASSNDYDLFLISSTGTVKASSTNIQSGTQNPYEQITPLSLVAGDRLVVFKTAAAQVRVFAINTIRGKLTVTTSGQVHGHNTALDAYSVAATPAVSPGPYPAAFSGSNQVEGFSSDGPRRIFYNANGTAITPGNFLIATNGGTVRNKPDITAADGVSTTLGASSGLNPFYGTSAAAPHAGAIAALIKSANPAITPAQMRTLLTSTAVDIESGGYDFNSGFGIVQAFQAMQSVSPVPVTADVTPFSYTISEGTGSNANGVIDPGENGNIVIVLGNTLAGSANAVNAIVSTSTAGVSITQGTAGYGTIGAGSNASNSGTPFRFFVNTAVDCGTQIIFSVAITFTGGVSPQSFLFKVNVGSQTPTISATMGSSPAGTATYTTLTGTQTGRLNRFAPASVCAVSKTNPGLFSATGSRQYTAYTFLNTSTSNQCVTVSLNNTNGTGVYCAAYNNAGFIPATPNINFLADAGASNYNVQYGFTAPASQSFTIVVHDVNVLPTTGAVYNLNVSLSACDIVIPVTWLSFTAKPKNNQSFLQWKIANELNVDHYEVEYSIDGRQFNTLYSLPTDNLNSIEKDYEQIHPFPVEGNNYYRIKQVDKDSHFSYSQIVIVKMEKGTILTINPNPATAYINIESKFVIEQVQLFNATGQMVANTTPGRTNYQLQMSKFPIGQYSLRVLTNDQIIYKSIIKQ